MDLANDHVTSGRVDLAPLARQVARLSDWSAMALGLAVCAVIPTIFWCGVIWFGGRAVGLAPSPALLATIGTAITGFLTVIASVVMANR